MLHDLHLRIGIKIQSVWKCLIWISTVDNLYGSPVVVGFGDSFNLHIFCPGRCLPREFPPR